MANDLNEILNEIKKEDFNVIAPSFKKEILTNEEINKILEIISENLGIEKQESLIGIILLLLKGAANNGAPLNMSIDLKKGKSVTKQDLIKAYLKVTGNKYLRRLAESLAINIGEFAEHFCLSGELAQRINTTLKSQTGETLSLKEMAWCSSFSQNIPDLGKRSSERLVKLLAEDYKQRFEYKKKTNWK